MIYELRRTPTYPDLRPTHHLDAQGEPFAFVGGLTALAGSLTPDQLDALARQIKQIAIDCRRHAAEQNEAV